MKKILLGIFVLGGVLLILLSCKIDYKDFDKKTTIWDDAKEISYYKENNLQRYKEYKNKNDSKTLEQVIIDVNIGLDKEFYTDTIETKDRTKLLLVNKYHYLDKDYIPKNLVTINNTKLVDYAAKEFKEMISDASKENLTIIGVSGYRSYSYQENLYNKYVKNDGTEKADTYSARPGYSEHQTGLAIDVSNSKLPYTSFEQTDEFKWMQENAHKYGFILRYPNEKSSITGYMYESWHYRYVGVEVVTYIKKHNITFDEYYAMFLDK